MQTLRWPGFLFLALFCALPLAGDLKKALAEKNLEKRSGLAMENATAALKAARNAYKEGDNARTAAAIAEIQESVELAATSLAQTGKNPRRSPKWFKRAEIGTRDLLRRLDAFENEMSFVDRPMLEKATAKVHEVHDELLVGLMEGKRE